MDEQQLPQSQKGGNKAQRTRRKILDGARDELAARDGHLEIASVAARSEVSPGLIYRYFNSRTDLIAAVVEDFYDRYDQWVMDVNPVPGASWLVRERERVSRCLHFIEREPLSAMVFLSQQKDPEVATVESRRLRAHLEMAVANVESAQEKGEIPSHIDPVIASAMTMGGIREVMAQIINNRHKQNHELTLDHIMTYIAGAMDIRD